MKIKAAGFLFDSDREPLMIVLTPQDKERIKAMGDDQNEYIIFPKHMTREQVQVWANSEPRPE